MMYFFILILSIQYHVLQYPVRFTVVCPHFRLDREDIQLGYVISLFS